MKSSVKEKKYPLLLGVNIDHVATLRQARGGTQPDLVSAALAAICGGADSITVHLREDRRHIQDSDLPALMMAIKVPLNLELALVPEIISIAMRLGPDKVCIVPEKRKEVTTEGGLDVRANLTSLRMAIPKLQSKKIEVSLFIDPDLDQIKLSAELGADAIEIHTGSYANAKGALQKRELEKVRQGAKLAHGLGLKVHAGHGLDYENVQAMAKISELRELNIGHAIISRSIYKGIQASVREMKNAMKR